MKTKELEEFNYKELVNYIRELNSDMWICKKSCEKYPNSIEMNLYARALENCCLMLDEIDNCINQ